MERASIPVSEMARQQAVDELELGSLGSDQRFLCYARIAAQALSTPMSAMTVISRERQLFKAAVGLGSLGSSRAESICSHTILGTTPMCIGDTRVDPRFFDNPMVSGTPAIRSYIGAPVRAPSGANIGAICAMDSKVRTVTDGDARLIADLAHMIENELLLYAMAIRDPVTLMYLRDNFNDLAERSWRHAHNLGASCGLILVSVDRYLSCGRAFGKQGVNHALRMVGQCIKDCCDVPEHIAGHLHDDRFAVFVAFRESEYVAALGDRIRTTVKQRGANERASGRDVTVSVGVAAHASEILDDRSMNDLQERALQALRVAKANGGNSINVSLLNRRGSSVVALPRELRRLGEGAESAALLPPEDEN